MFGILIRDLVPLCVAGCHRVTGRRERGGQAAADDLSCGLLPTLQSSVLGELPTTNMLCSPRPITDVAQLRPPGLRSGGGMGKEVVVMGAKDLVAWIDSFY